MTKNAFTEMIKSLECCECGKKLTPYDACLGDSGIICQDCLNIRETSLCDCQYNNETCICTPTDQNNKEDTL